MTKVRRIIAALLTVAFAAVLSVLVTPGSASAASTTSDYIWHAWVRCQFSTNWTYDNVRWRIDWRHDPFGNRNGKAVTYVETQGSSGYVLESAVQSWASNGATISSAGRSGSFGGNSLWYEAPAQTWTAPLVLTNMTVALSFSDGDTCIARSNY